MTIDTNIVFNYFKMLSHEGEVLGFGALEKGTPNEITIVNQAFDFGVILAKSTKEEFDKFEGNVVKNFENVKNF